MLTATFYRKSASSQAAAETKAAAGDARRAADALRQVLELGVRPDGGSKIETQAVLDEATERLRALQMRVAGHAELVKLVEERERLVDVARAKGKGRLDEVEKGIIDTNVRRVNILAAKDEIRRDLVLARRALQEDKDLVASGADVLTDDESDDDCARPTESMRIAELASGDWDDSLDMEEAAGL